MPINIYKNNGASILTINNFTNLMIDGNTPTDAWGDISDAETKAILLKSTGPTMQISFEYTLVDEASTVVSGTGGTVTTARGQMKYLYDTLMSTGTTQFTDKYHIIVSFSTTNLDSGTASAGSASTLTDGSKSWVANAYAGMVLKITGGTGSGQVRNIISNTGTVLTISSDTDLDFDTTPDNTSTYAIVDGFSRAGTLTRITCQAASDSPLTFRGSMSFQVGLVL